MNEYRIEGAGQELLGQGEKAAGQVFGSERLEGEGIVNQVAGAVQNGYGRAKDAVNNVLDDAPAVIGNAAERGRDAALRGDRAIRERLGDQGPGIVAVGAVALIAFGILAFVRTRSKPATSARRKPRPRATAARRKSSAS